MKNIDKIDKSMLVLRKKMDVLREQREELEFSKLLPELRQKYEGKYFKFRNSYSCPETQEDYWYIYFRCDKVENKYTAICAKLEKTKDKIIRIETKAHEGFSLLEKECSEKEFYDTLKKLQAEIKTIGARITI